MTAKKMFCFVALKDTGSIFYGKTQKKLSISSQMLLKYTKITVSEALRLTNIVFFVCASFTILQIHKAVHMLTIYKPTVRSASLTALSFMERGVSN